MSRAPTLAWYAGISEERGVHRRCPFATVDACPRYYQSLALLGLAGSTRIDPNEEQRLENKWKASDLWPRTGEQATSVSGPNGRYTHFSLFCPEVSFERFGLFASSLNEYADSLDRSLAHQRLERERAAPDDWAWSWAFVSPMHFTDCALYSILAHRAAHQPPREAPSPAPTLAPPGATSCLRRSWEYYGREIVIGVIVTIVGGVALAWLLGPL